MNFLRTTPVLSSLTRQHVPIAARQSLIIRAMSTSPIARATQGYGDGKGDPRGEDPQAQGSSNSTKENAEHPGPAAPSEGQGTGGGPTKAGNKSSKSPEDASAQSGGARSKEAKETGSSPTGGQVGGKEPSSTASESASEKSKNGHEPKIQSRSQPGRGNDKAKEAEVEQHNKEFEERHDRAGNAEPDKVDKKFWKGGFEVFFLEGLHYLPKYLMWKLC